MKYDAKLKRIYVGVDELSATVMRRGNIDVRHGARMSPLTERAAEAVTREYGGAFTRGVTLTKTVNRGGLFFEISGECDGVAYKEKYSVNVARTVSVRTDYINADMMAEHLAQGVFFACALADEKSLTALDIILTYYHTPNDIKRITKTLSKRELDSALLRLVDMFLPYCSYEIERQAERIPSAAAVSFPYKNARQTQKDFMVEALRGFTKSQRALIEAPTGTGKTMAALFPAVRAFGKGFCDKIFYFTPKTTTAAAALSACANLSKGCGLRAMTISAKERICPTKHRGEYKCTPEICPHANGHYTRVGDAILDALSSYRVLDENALCAIAEKHCVCPYELSLDLSEYCDAVVCDCNYLLSPRAYLRRYFSYDEVGAKDRRKFDGRYVFLIDEAHNLPQRAKECFGGILRRREFALYLEETRNIPEKEVRAAVSAIIEHMNYQRELFAQELYEDENGRVSGAVCRRDFDDKLEKLLKTFVSAADKAAFSDSPTLPESIFALSRTAKDYIASLELSGSEFSTLIVFEGDEITMQNNCLDPSRLLDLRLSQGISSLLFSATLTPMEYYKNIFGCTDAASLKLDSPYDRQNLCVCVLDKISTKFSVRGENTGEIADAIMTAVSAREGNYMVYFPSYEYLTEVQNLFRYKYPYIKTEVQTRGMKSAERTDFLSRFSGAAKTPTVGFCVLGGIYSEGIDLMGDDLIGAIIIGVGLPGLSNQNEQLREYFENRYEEGQNYAYVYPGFNRIMQAAGRVIRSATDRGILVLIDERYNQPSYKSLFPPYWRHAKFCGDTTALDAVLKKFWADKKH